MRGLGIWRGQENQMNRLSLNQKAYISLPHHNLAQRSWFEPENTDLRWKLAAFHLSTTSTKFGLTLLNAGKRNQGEKNGHFGEMHPSEMFPFSTKIEAGSENQIHFATQIVRPWLAPQGPVPAELTPHSLTSVNHQIPLCHCQLLGEALFLLMHITHSILKQCLGWFPEPSGSGYFDYTHIGSTKFPICFPLGLDCLVHSEEAPRVPPTCCRWHDSPLRPKNSANTATQTELEVCCHFLPIVTWAI